MARVRTLAGIVFTTALCIWTSACALFPTVPSPELGEYALGMTYVEALGVTGDFTGGQKPPWPAWPPTSMRVAPPPGTQNMRLVFTGECVTAIEVRYPGICEEDLVAHAGRAYGPPISHAHGKHVWTDGVREVILTTQLDLEEPFCKPICAHTCALTYRLARTGLGSGPASSSHGLAACRAMGRRHEVRWRPDLLHTFKRHGLDGLGYLLRAP